MCRIYQIRLREQLTEDWSAWFADLHVQRLPTGETELRGWLDQAALHGILARIRDLNLTLMTVNLVDEAGTPDRQPASHP